MKRLFIILVSLLFFITVDAQIPRFSLYNTLAAADEGGYGSNLVATGGAFPSGLWEVGTGWSIPGDGTMNNANTNDYQACYLTSVQLDIAFEVLTDYRIEFDLVVTGGGANTAHLGWTFWDDTELWTSAQHTTGHITIDITTPASVASNGLGVYNMNLSDAAYTITNLVIREIL